MPTWILWRKFDVYGSQHGLWEPIAGFNTREECITQVDKLISDHEDRLQRGLEIGKSKSQAIAASFFSRFDGIEALVTDPGKDDDETPSAFTHFRCLPDTVDPREHKEPKTVLLDQVQTARITVVRGGLFTKEYVLEFLPQRKQI